MDHLFTLLAQAAEPAAAEAAAQAVTQAVEEAPKLALNLRIPFSILHFLEFAVWGAWYVVLGNYLNSLNFSRKWIGTIYATIPLGAIISPMIGGAIADAFGAGKLLFGGLHLAGGVCLLAMALAKKPLPFYLAALAYALLYSPTLALVNSVVFEHLPDAARDFPTIRVLGTIGWIAAGMSLRFFVRPGQPMNNRPLLLATALSFILGIFSIAALPDPPAKEETAVAAAAVESTDDDGAKEVDLSKYLPFLNAIKMLAEPRFGTFIGVSFLITIALAFYYSFTALYLEQQCKVASENVGPLMTIGQWVEIIFLFTLPWFLQSWGMKGVLAIGMLAWGLRYLFFSVGRPFVLVVIGIALHGICFDFFFAAGMIHTENVAAEGIKASAQSLFAVVTYGLGMWIGTEASGWLNHSLTTHVTDEKTGVTTSVTNWRTFWIIPSVVVFVCLALFLFLFRV